MPEERTRCPRCESTDLDTREQWADRLVPMRELVTVCSKCGFTVSTRPLSQN